MEQLVINHSILAQLRSRGSEDAGRAPLYSTASVVKWVGRLAPSTDEFYSRAITR